MKIFTVTLVCLSLCGCSYFKSKLTDIKGSLIGNGYTIDTYDNYGNKVLETKEAYYLYINKSRALIVDKKDMSDSDITNLTNTLKEKVPRYKEN